MKMEFFNFNIQNFVKQKFCIEDFKLLDHQKNKFKADSARHLVREAAGHDVHLQGDGVHEALPPGETIFICRTRRSTAARLLWQHSEHSHWASEVSSSCHRVFWRCLYGWAFNHVQRCSEFWSARVSSRTSWYHITHLFIELWCRKLLASSLLTDICK